MPDFGYWILDAGYWMGRYGIKGYWILKIEI